MGFSKLFQRFIEGIFLLEIETDSTILLEVLVLAKIIGDIVLIMGRLLFALASSFLKFYHKLQQCQPG